MHDTVQLAINHAGYASITETRLIGKMHIMLSFVFDKFVNAANGEEAGISLSLDKYTMVSDEMALKVPTLLDTTANTNSTYAQRWKTICRLNNDKARAIVSNAVQLAASVGIDHLVPRDVTLSLSDRLRRRDGGRRAARARAADEGREELQGLATQCP